MQPLSDFVWSHPPRGLELKQNQVHIWRAMLEVTSAVSGRIERVLSRDEIGRANRFLFVRDRQRFIVARGFLRAIIGLYLDCPPTALHFDYGEHGKPFLSDGDSKSDLNFNLAHSASLAIYGFTRKEAIGIDLEEIRRDIDAGEIAKHFFSPNESRRLLSIPPIARTEAFFSCWTLKEAFIKAKGIGMSLPLDQFDVGFLPSEPRLLETKWDQDEFARWSLRAIDVGLDYAAAVAVVGSDWKPSYWQASNDILFPHKPTDD
jgi:4'-phosphopantetheinyl transferase